MWSQLHQAYRPPLETSGVPNLFGFFVPYPQQVEGVQYSENPSSSGLSEAPTAGGVWSQLRQVFGLTEQGGCGIIPSNKLIGIRTCKGDDGDE